MTANEFSAEFDLLYNNISSNQAPGLNEFEKSQFLTKAQNEIIKNYFTSVQGGNKYQQGIEDSNKRLSDFSCLIKVFNSTAIKKAAINKEEDFSPLLNDTVLHDYWDIPLAQGTETEIKMKAVLKIPTESDPFTQSLRLVISASGNISEAFIAVKTVKDSFNIYTFNINSFKTFADKYELYCQYYKDPSDGLWGPIDEETSAIQGITFTAEVQYIIEGIANTLDPRGVQIIFPSDLFIQLHESITIDSQLYQVYPITLADYQRLMSKPSGDPLKRQVWKLLGSNDFGDNGVMEIIPHWKNKDKTVNYSLRYVRTPYPIILEDLEAQGLTIEGKDKPWGEVMGQSINADGSYNVCELHPEIHQEIVQRAVELAKVVWASSQEEIAAVQTHVTSGQRSE